MRQLATFALICAIANGQILVYNTENDETIEKFDCIYFVNESGESIPYCQRLKGTEPINRSSTTCANGGEKRRFRDLINERIAPSEVLRWSSSVEITDLYGHVFDKPWLIDENDERFVCNCVKPGTFGKYCEYSLTHNQQHFFETIKAQFKQKELGDSWNTQRYGKILCYETLPCNSSPLCLDWREICDGVQRCSSGIDEENWDKLEFNECEDDEFRCTNGMCIAEEFWLDGR